MEKKTSHDLSWFVDNIHEIEKNWKREHFGLSPTENMRDAHRGLTYNDIAVLAIYAGLPEFLKTLGWVLDQKEVQELVPQ